MKTLNGIEIKPDESYTIVYQANYLTSKFTHITTGFRLKEDWLDNGNAFEPKFQTDDKVYMGTRCASKGPRFEDCEISILAVMPDAEAVRRLMEQRREER